MRRFLLTLIAASLSTLGLYAHTVIWDHGYPGPMALPFTGGDPRGVIGGTISVVPVEGEHCVVNASATASSDLLVVFPNSKEAVQVDFFVYAGRRPRGGFEQAVVSGSWRATGVPANEGCNASGLIFVVVGVNDPGTPSPTTPTNANSLGGAFVGDPIWDNTGEVTQSEGPDLGLGGLLPLRFIRYYASLLKDNGVTSALGNNWMHNLDLKLAVSGANATVTLFRGQTVTFKQSGPAWQLANPERTNYQLVVSGTDFKFLDPQSNRIYTFSGAGALTRIEDRNGNALTVTQGASGPTSISDGRGRTLTLAYTGNKLTGVTDQTGRSIAFTYSGDDLTAYTDADGKRFTYAYTTAGSKTSFLVSETLPAGNKPVTHSFDSSSRATRETDSRGNSMTVAYNTPSAGVSTTTDPLSAATRHGYQNNALMAYTDATGQSSAFTYDSAGRRTSVTDRLGDRTTVTYHDPSGFVSSYTDALGNTTRYSYTAQTQGLFTFYTLTGLSYADGTSTSMTYDAAGNLTALTDRAGKRWSFTYNSSGQALTATNPTGGVTTYTYNDDGTVASVKLHSGDTTTFSYDASKRLSQITRPDGKTRQFAYDNRDNVLRVTDELGNVTALAINDNGKLRSITDALNATAALNYDGDERLAAAIDPLGKGTNLQYNELGLLKQATDPTGVSLSYGYNSQQRLTSITNAAGKGVTMSYDREGVPSSLTDALSNTRRLASDKMGRITSVTDPLGGTSSATYDKMGRVTSTTDALGRATSYTYESRGLLTGVTAPGGISASFERNELGQISKITDPNGNVWRGNYDAQGRLVSAVDPVGNATSYTYDSQQRVSQVALPVGSIQPSYDDAGNVVRRLYGDGTDFNYSSDKNNRLMAANGVSLGYDARGSITSSNGLTIGRDDAGRISTITYAPAKTVTYSYNNRGQIVRVADWVAGTTELSYDDAGRLVSLTRPNGVTRRVTYDNNGRTASIADTGGKVTSSLTLSRDAAGQITSASRTTPRSADPAGGSLPLAYDAAHQVQGFSYDAMGRVTSDGLRAYSWNQASQLMSITGADGAASFTYDALGLRVSSTSGGSTRDYVLNYALGLPSVSVVRTAGSDTRYYIYLPNGVLLHSIEAADNKRHFYHFDEMGSTLFLTDDGGSVSDAYSFTPYGEDAGRSGNTDNPFTFLGAYGVMQEGSTALYYIRARFYDSAAARFLSRTLASSANPRSINPYQYGWANPLRFANLLGR